MGSLLFILLQFLRRGELAGCAPQLFFWFVLFLFVCFLFPFCRLRCSPTSHRLSGTAAAKCLNLYLFHTQQAPKASHSSIFQDDAFRDLLNDEYQVQVWWYPSVIPAMGRWKQVYLCGSLASQVSLLCGFKASEGPCLKLFIGEQ